MRVGAESVLPLTVTQCLADSGGSMGAEQVKGQPRGTEMEAGKWLRPIFYV